MQQCVAVCLFMVGYWSNVLMMVYGKAPHSPERRRDATQPTMIRALRLVTKMK